MATTHKVTEQVSIDSTVLAAARRAHKEVSGDRKITDLQLVELALQIVRELWTHQRATEAERTRANTFVERYRRAKRGLDMG